MPLPPKALKSITADVPLPSPTLPLDRILDAPFPAVESGDVRVECSLPTLDIESGTASFTRTGGAFFVDLVVPSGPDAFRSAVDTVQVGEAGALIPADSLGQMEQRDPDGGRGLRFVRCQANGAQAGDGTLRVKIDIGAVEVGAEPGPGERVYEAFVLRGFSLKVWPGSRSRETDGGGFRSKQELLNTEIDDEPVVMRRVDEEHVRVVFLADRPYGSRQLTPLWLWLSFLGGHPLRVVQSEAYAADGSPLYSRTYHAPEAPLQRRTPPIPLNLDTTEEAEFLFRLGETVRDGYPAFRRWSKDIFLKEAIHHLHSGTRAHLESRLALYSIAFETLASSYVRHVNGDVRTSARYIDKGTFKRLIKPVVKLFRERFQHLAEELDDAESIAKVIEGKIYSANNRAMQDRLQVLLGDLRLRPTVAEADALRHRNSAIHEGVLTRDRDNVDVQALFDMEETLLTLLNKIVLRLTGYDDLIVAYGTAGWPSVRLSELLVNEETEEAP